MKATNQERIERIRRQARSKRAEAEELEEEAEELERKARALEALGGDERDFVDSAWRLIGWVEDDRMQLYDDRDLVKLLAQVRSARLAATGRAAAHIAAWAAGVPTDEIGELLVEELHQLEEAFA